MLHYICIRYTLDMLHCEIIGKLFKFLCVLFAMFFVGLWCYKYYLDEDIYDVDVRSYHYEQDDIYPVMSICFNQSLHEAILQKYGQHGPNYIKYLYGEYFGDSMPGINYSNISTNITEFLLAYVVNGKTLVDIGENTGWKDPYYHYSHLNTFDPDHQLVLKCFGVEITDKNITSLELIISRDIFPYQITEDTLELMILFHYPNQVLRASNSAMFQFPILRASNGFNFKMTFHLKGMDVIERRNKKHRKCIEDWRNYDNIIFEEHMKSIKCKAPYQESKENFSNCASQDKMKDVQLFFDNHNSKKYPPPCREIESVRYDYGETLFPCTDGPFKIEMRISNHHFKKITQKQRIGHEKLIENASGYIGLFLSIGVMQIPEVAIAAYTYIKKCFRKRFRKSFVAPQTTADNLEGNVKETLSGMSETTPLNISKEAKNVENTITDLHKKLSEICADITRMDNELKRVNRTPRDQFG